ncbi:aryl-alcohol dehydrogenase-like predicted oxidoreductase [Kitasatospora sp. SolWspMP-SS2h]|uniref:aldo/keto reductase n=1 Tax=Kitasatospora sp. SolWspMP-SS2h TaxID=1305729 RepID=UPI000DB9D412|nr:aldo/keto reductase [Kitasatospora sp. SolWspMP-SS2h]RAJ42172.1 aryl-alcohol dehydrogenase-like predicted oxidoreductase [Kitasatospora sp. SolWspMP-SS2h]
MTTSEAPRVTLGPSDLAVSPLSLGGNVFGWTADAAQSFAVLDAYAAAGGNFIDTADVYSAWAPGNSGGESETVIGDWLRSRGDREQIVVATKVGSLPGLDNLRADTIKRGAEASLRRLGVERIDLLYTHKDDLDTPVEEIVTALDELVRAGKVREVAASNIGPERLAASLEFAGREGLATYVAVQPHYNLVSRDTYEGPLADVVAAHGLSCVPYYALASGFLTGKYRPGTVVDSARAQGAGRYLDDPRGPRVLAALDEVAAAHGTQVATVALAWLAAQPTVAAPLASARTPEQLPPLLAAASLRLTGAELELLSEASA